MTVGVFLAATHGGQFWWSDWAKLFYGCSFNKLILIAKKCQLIKKKMWFQNITHTRKGTIPGGQIRMALGNISENIRFTKKRLRQKFYGLSSTLTWKYFAIYREWHVAILNINFIISCISPYIFLHFWALQKILDVFHIGCPIPMFNCLGNIDSWKLAFYQIWLITVPKL